MPSDRIDAALERIEEREKAATPGPWRRVEEYADEPGDYVIEECPTKDRSRGGYCIVAQTLIEDGYGRSPQERKDAAFIAAARTDVPALLASLRSAVEGLERITTCYCESSGSCPGCIARASLAAIERHLGEE
jgi:hypothetical protein